MKTEKPKTERELAVYRYELNIKVAKDAMEGKIPTSPCPRIEYAFFGLLCALQELPAMLKEEQ